MLKPISFFAILILLVACPFQSYAAIVKGFATGIIAERAETDGIGNLVFGLEGPAMLGMPFVINFNYDTDQAPLTSFIDYGNGSRSIYTSSETNQNWLDLSLTVNNLTHTVAGFNRQADIEDNGIDEFGQISNDNLNFLLEGTTGELNSPIFYRQFLDFNLIFPFDTLASSMLPLVFSTNNIEPGANGAFSINELETDPGTGETLHYRRVRLDLDIHTIEMNAIPLPPTILFLASSLIVLLVQYKK